MHSLTQAPWFSHTAMCAIALNAVLLGVETYAGFAHRWATPLGIVEHVLLGLFALEILVRALAHADRPSDFFRNPWNIFDALVVLCAFTPGIGQDSTVLRLLRLARVIRTARFLPQLRIILNAIGKSLPGMASFLLVGSLVLYLYAMIGWTCFATADPEHYGSLGRAVITLFVLMTLDGLGEAVRAGLDISPWSFAYYASYVLLSSFLLVNLLIGVVINSLDQARVSEETFNASQAPKPDPAAIHESIAALRAGLDQLEQQLPLVPAQPERLRKS
ncbi:ion transporter [Streptomyces kanamyceticus]|uniref:ion transporter n=1 Tax=Streptomyces kanamyceticus TaxID=1967 RepID=UPI001CC754E7